MLTTKYTVVVDCGSMSISVNGIPSPSSKDVPQAGVAVCEITESPMVSLMLPSLINSIGKRTSVPERPVWSVAGVLISML